MATIGILIPRWDVRAVIDQQPSATAVGNRRRQPTAIQPPGYVATTMASTPAVHHAAPDRISAANWRIVLLASLGGTLEFYDFVIFGVFARDIAATLLMSMGSLQSES